MPALAMQYTCFDSSFGQWQVFHHLFMQGFKLESKLYMISFVALLMHMCGCSLMNLYNFLCNFVIRCMKTHLMFFVFAEFSDFKVCSGPISRNFDLTVKGSIQNALLTKSFSQPIWIFLSHVIISKITSKILLQ